MTTLVERLSAAANAQDAAARAYTGEARVDAMRLADLLREAAACIQGKAP